MPEPRTRPVPRELAIRALGQVLSQGVHADAALEEIFSTVSEPSNRHWLQDVVHGTLRWKGRLDWALDSVSHKKKPTGWLRRVLLVAAYQIIVQERVRDASVVFETVDLIKSKEGPAPANFANATLRRLSETADSWLNLPFPERATNAVQAQWASLPEWMWTRLLKDRGFKWTQDFAKACLQRPELWLRAREDFKKGAEIGEIGPLPTSIKVSHGSGTRVTEIAGFSEGQWVVQDISSQLLVDHVVRACAGVGIGRGARALDVCAAPGGKSVGLAWNGFKVLASDADAKRVPLLRNTIERVGDAFEIAASVEEGLSAGPFDLVWVAAPCSGSGILRRHPDVRWVRSEADVASLEMTQLSLLQRVWSAVRPGGVLAYSVCSVFASEGTEQIARVSGAERLGEWLIAPHEQGGDGFYGAALRKPS